MNKTKIICTVGPCCCGESSLKKLIRSGMNIARLNGSHNTLQWHGNVIKRIRAMDNTIAVLFDLPGRKIRTQNHKNDFYLSKGAEVIITSDENYKGKDKVSVNHNGLHRFLKKDDIFFADDGALKFKVEAIKGKDIVCRALTEGVLKGGKGLNVPRVKLNAASVTKADYKAVQFAVKSAVDWVGISFVENARQVRKIKKLLSKSAVGVISKIETQSALNNLEAILEESSGVMVDRGDLGAEIGIERIGLVQKEIIAKANELGKPVIIATEMLHSMIERSQPTKAEIVDISNSILDGASAIMLSGETAIGRNPVAAVKVMRAVANEVESKYSVYGHGAADTLPKHASIPNAVGRSICEICKEMPIDKVVCITLSGYSSRMISRYRVKPSILAVSDTIERSRSFNLLWGVEGISLNLHFHRREISHIVEVAKKLWEMGKIVDSETVIFTAVIFPIKNNKMNFLMIHKISDLKEIFKWNRR